MMTDSMRTAAPCSPRVAKIIAAALPSAQVLRVVPLGKDDASVSGETLKGTGYGVPLRIDVVDQGRPRSLVLHTATANEYGHDRRADRAAAALLSADTFDGIPRHVRVVDVGAFRGDEDSVSLASTGEFYLLTSHAEGRVYAEDLRRIARDCELLPSDVARRLALVDYLVELHERKLPGVKGYQRFVRDTLGSGEGIFGIVDGYPDGVPAASRQRLGRIEEECLRWRARLRHRGERLCRTHGDFHPFNVLFDDDSGLSVLDASRGALGDPADDVVCMTINYAFFSLGQPGAWRALFRPLWQGFWDAYLEKTGDAAMLEVVAPLFAWRCLVLANPCWYPDLGTHERDRLLAFAERVLLAERFVPEMATEFFDA